jgi:hypothetical protein
MASSNSDYWRPEGSHAETGACCPWNQRNSLGTELPGNSSASVARLCYRPTPQDEIYRASLAGQSHPDVNHRQYEEGTVHAV